MGRRVTRWRRVTGFAIGGLVAVATAASAQTELTACGPLVTGNYVLKRNLRPTGDCFTLMGDNVAIDLKGKTITGDGTGSAITDGSTFRNSAVIHNGKIRNFFIGIDLGSSGNANLDKLDVSNNASHGIWIGECCNTLNAVKANNNGGDGVQALEGFHSVTKSSATGNGSSGFDLQGCCSSFTSSKSKNNTGNGVTMTGCCNAATRSDVSGNGAHGIEATGCCNFVIDSKFQKNGADGVLMDGCCNIMERSTASNNGETESASSVAGTRSRPARRTRTRGSAST